jgi:tRNA threonylcarbamoyladenosine biosynthesis protein TsaB
MTSPDQGASPTLLAFDTATPSCTVALRHEGRDYVCENRSSPKHASVILPMLTSLLREAGIEGAQVQAVAFGVGPGSFMGVRTASSVAQALAFSWGVPGLAFSTLQAVAQDAYLTQGAHEVMVAWDARMRSVYAGFYVCEDGIMKPHAADALYAYEAWPACPTSMPDAVGAGNAWALVDEAVPQAVRPARCFEAAFPSGQALLALAEHAWFYGARLKPDAMQPLYLRRAVVGR